jgi:hypothetical protein
MKMFTVPRDSRVPMRQHGILAERESIVLEV